MPNSRYAHSVATCHRLSNYRGLEVRAGKLENWPGNINPELQFYSRASSVVLVINEGPDNGAPRLNKPAAFVSPRRGKWPSVLF